MNTSDIRHQRCCCCCCCSLFSSLPNKRSHFVLSVLKSIIHKIPNDVPKYQLPRGQISLSFLSSSNMFQYYFDGYRLHFKWLIKCFQSSQTTSSQPLGYSCVKVRGTDVRALLFTLMKSKVRQIVFRAICFTQKFRFLQKWIEAVHVFVWLAAAQIQANCAVSSGYMKRWYFVCSQISSHFHIRFEQLDMVYAKRFI